MNFYRLARQASTVQTIASGDPGRIARRVRNRGIAKGLGAVGFWRVWGKVWR